MKTIKEAKAYLEGLGFKVNKQLRRDSADEDWQPFGWQTDKGDSHLKFNNDDDLIGFAKAMKRVVT